MKCRYFKICGGCSLPLDYEEQLEIKTQKVLDDFREVALLLQEKVAIFTSPKESFRGRLELGITHSKDTLTYAMRTENKELLSIENCPIALPIIQHLGKKLLPFIQNNAILQKKLFAIEFLATKLGNILITLLYHTPLPSLWESSAKELSQTLKANLIGRSRGQKIFLNYNACNELIEENLEVLGHQYTYFYSENAFVQPNPFVNEKMIQWACECAMSLENTQDLLELYCGSGNFTLPLAKYFKKVIATEVCRQSIVSAKLACEKNGIKNIDFVRLSGEECLEAFSKKRSFNRLKSIDLAHFTFSCVFVDPPRAGLGVALSAFLQHFKSIIYISCNPTSLLSDLAILTQSHTLVKLAFFDQFPYTKHLECGVLLLKNT